MPPHRLCWTRLRKCQTMQASYRTATLRIPRRMPLPDSALTQNSSAASLGVRQPANIRRATDLPRVHATRRDGRRELLAVASASWWSSACHYIKRKPRAVCRPRGAPEQRAALASGALRHDPRSRWLSTAFFLPLTPHEAAAAVCLAALQVAPFCAVMLSYFFGS